MNRSVSLLTPQEQALLTQAREQKAAHRDILEFTSLAVETASEYRIWLSSRGRTDSLSTFVNDFGFQGQNSKVMYEWVQLTLQAYKPTRWERLRILIKSYIDRLKAGVHLCIANACAKRSLGGEQNGR